MGLKYEAIVVNGVEHPVLVIDRDEDTGEALLYRQLKERILKIKLNIEKCGSYEKMLELGGEQTKIYLKNTKNLVIDFLITYQLDWVLTRLEDINDAIIAVNQIDVAPLVEKASWEGIVAVADNLRKSLINHWYERKTAAKSSVQRLSVA